MALRTTPSPIRQVLLKVHSRCNLSCTYCYVYHHADQSWRRQPATMSRAIVDIAAERIGSHARAWQLPKVTVILHGGEPLMAGADLIEHAVRAIRAAAPEATQVDFTVQTNGLLLRPPLLEMFLRQDIRVGISLDGGQSANDRHRLFAHGGGSYRPVAKALALLRQDRYRRLYSGLLCTIDIRNDPVGVYEDLLSFAPPRMDLLLPHGNWTTPPPFRVDNSDTPYADWLIAVFDRWYGAPRRETDIRLFSSIMTLIVGGRSGSEAVGLEPIDLITVETDGSIEQGDALKTTADGMAATGLTITDHSFDEALRHPGVRARQQGLAALCHTCQSCPVVSICGGGLYAHRYREHNGFANPTVYCADQRKLIEHIYTRMAADLRRLSAQQSPTTETAVITR
ncbi:FxsB family cyclophane-forming radical SAM/SPASM peptide maturase [Actinomycetes bacterium KLBMP 9797]